MNKASPVVITKVTVVTEVKPLLFNKNWTTEDKVLSRTLICSHCKEPMKRGMTALVLLRNGRPRYTFCSVHCQRQAYLDAKAVMDKKWDK